MSVPLVLVGSAALFVLQVALLVKAESVVVRLIPAYAICAMAAYSVATYFGLFGTYSFGAISGNELAGLVLLAITGVEAVGPLLAWVAYGAMTAVRRRKGASS